MQLLWGRGCPASYYGFDALPLFVRWRPAKGSFPLCRRCLRPSPTFGLFFLPCHGKTPPILLPPSPGLCHTRASLAIMLQRSVIITCISIIYFYLCIYVFSLLSVSVVRNGVGGWDSYALLIPFWTCRVSTEFCLPRV